MPITLTIYHQADTSVKVEFASNNVQSEAYQKESGDSDDVFDSDWSFFTDGQRHCHAHDEEEGWEDEVSSSQAVPVGMADPERRVVDRPNVVHHDHSHHGESSVDVEGLDAYFRLRLLRGLVYFIDFH
jgi:hypothetical protein